MRTFSELLFRIAIAAALGIAIRGTALADQIVFSNFGPGMTFNTLQSLGVTGSNISGGQILAQAFTPSGDFTFSSAQLAMGIIGGPNILQVVLMTSSGGLPSNIMESIMLTNAVAPLTSPGIVLANSVLHPAITSGTQYWLVAFASNPDTNMSWPFSFNDFSTPIVRGFTSLSGPWDPVIGPGVPRPAFQINGASIPEPATIFLLGPALALLALKGRSHKLQQSQYSVSKGLFSRGSRPPNGESNRR
jgi:hypothetical protein